MAIIKDHISIYKEIFKNPELISGHIATIGFQDILGKKLPQDYNYPDFKKFLIHNHKTISVTTIDPFDDRSDLKYDLNLPVPNQEIEKYDCIIDIGSLEHIFDTKQAIENCMRMIKVNGHYFLHTAVNGLSNHGLQTFNHLALIDAFRLNSFSIKYLSYSSYRGVPIKQPQHSNDSWIWLIGQKNKTMFMFSIPQQTGWLDLNKQLGYNNEFRHQFVSFVLPAKIDWWFEQMCPPLVFRLLRNIIVKIKLIFGFKFLNKKQNPQ